MPQRKTALITGEFYHMFNRSAGWEKIFSHPEYCKRALALIDFCRFRTPISYSQLMRLKPGDREELESRIHRSPPLLEILAFSLMPDHFHFLARQRRDDGLKYFIANFQNGIAKYYNLRRHRHGPVFSGRFKAVNVDSEKQFIHVSRYIHLNPVTSNLIEINQLDNFPNTSFSTYMNNNQSPFISRKMLDDHFGSKQRHKLFVYNQSGYQRKLKAIKKLLLDG